MTDVTPNQITLLLEQIRLGNDDARAKLAAAVYPELKKLAALQMRRERPNHTLQPTALANEVFLRLAAGEQACWRDRNHFFAVSAELIRRILVDYARRRHAAKRGAGARPVELEEWQAQIEERPDIVIEIDRLLTRLGSFDKRQAQIVEMRFFSGLTEQEIAGALGLSERTVKRDWNMARAWMHRELSL